MRIRMLTHVAGELAPGVPAPGYGAVIPVEPAVADAWADGERAELVPDDEPVTVDEQISQLHADAAAWTDAVAAEKDARIAELEAQLAGLAGKGKRS